MSLNCNSLSFDSSLCEYVPYLILQYSYRKDQRRRKKTHNKLLHRTQKKIETKHSRALFVGLLVFLLLLRSGIIHGKTESFVVGLSPISIEWKTVLMLDDEEYFEIR